MISENFIKLFESSVQKYWEFPAMTDSSNQKTITYKQCGEEIKKLHFILKANNIKEGDKVSIVGKNSTNWALSYIAIVTYGAVVVPILQDFIETDIRHIIDHSDSKLVFCLESIWKKIDASKLEDIDCVYSLNDFSLLLDRKGNAYSFVDACSEFNQTYAKGFTKEDVKYTERSNSELAVISYTSGSTGFSKGVMLTGNNLAGNVVFGINTRLFENPGDTVLSFLPLAHAYGCAFDFLTAFNCGGHIYFLDQAPIPKVLIEIFAKIHPVIVITVPLILEKIYKTKILPVISKPAMKVLLNIPGVNKIIYKKIRNQLYETFGGNFKQVIIGGAALSREVEDFFYKIDFPFTVGYGMTECAPLISYAEYPNFQPHTAGKILPGMEAKIDSPDPENIVGEILVKGEHLMMGYYKEPKITEETIDKNGWMHTGDMGTLSKDGTLSLKGRCKSMLLGPSGQNIYPEEIEAKLNNLPLVGESLVLEREGKLVALVYPDPIACHGISDEEIEKQMEINRKNLNKTIASYEGITMIKLHKEEFIKTPKKNIKRFLYTDIEI